MLQQTSRHPKSGVGVPAERQRLPTQPAAPSAQPQEVQCCRCGAPGNAVLQGRCYGLPPLPAATTATTCLHVKQAKQRTQAPPWLYE